MNVATPEKVGFSSERLKRLDALLQKWVDDRLLPGIHMLIWRRGAAAYSRCFGFMDVTAQKPIQTDTIYRIYSMTKPITSAAVMMLFEEGRLLLTDPVSAYIPEFKDLKVYVNENEHTDLERPMTIHHLLTHTSGLTYDFLITSPVDAMYRKADVLNRNISLKTMIDRLADDHANAKKLATGLSNIKGLLISPEPPQTNIVLFELAPGLPVEGFLAGLNSKRVKISSRGGNLFRAVTHRMISEKDIDEALMHIAEVCAGLRVRA